VIASYAVRRNPALVIDDSCLGRPQKCLVSTRFRAVRDYRSVAAAISFACGLGKRDNMRMQPDTRYTKAGEVKIAYQVLGDGR
jgi:hypothetical protein